MLVSALQICNLLAKVMVTYKRTPVAVADISYEVQWQAMACAHNSWGKTSQSMRFSSPQGSLWELIGKENGAPVARRSRRRRPTESTPVEGLQRASLHAQRHLADLQVSKRWSKVGSPISFLYRRV